MVDLTFYRAGERVKFKWDFELKRAEVDSPYYEGTIERWFWADVGPRALVNLDDGRQAAPMSGSGLIYLNDAHLYRACPECGWLEPNEGVCPRHRDIQRVPIDVFAL